MRVGTALLQQVHSTITQLRSQSISLAQSVARPSGEEEQTRTDATEEKAADRADQMCAIAFALERVSPELQDMVEELEMASPPPQGSGAQLDFAYKLHFTCPVCFDDEVSVHDAFVVSACGHPICRPCAIRSVDFNIKQLQPQVCPSCMGTPCPLCPITVWQRMRDLEERRSQRRMQRRAELRPDNSSRRQHPQIAAGLHSEGSSGGKGGLPGSLGEGIEHGAEASKARAEERGGGRRQRLRRRGAAAAHGRRTQRAGDENQHAQQLAQQHAQPNAHQASENAGPPPLRLSTAACHRLTCGCCYSQRSCSGSSWRCLRSASVHASSDASKNSGSSNSSSRVGISGGMTPLVWA